MILPFPRVVPQKSASHSRPNRAVALVREQYERLSLEERERFRRLLRAAIRLDRQLGELHLVLPALQIRFFGLAADPRDSPTFHPGDLEEELARWESSVEGIG